jgi:hypothetical protein
MFLQGLPAETWQKGEAGRGARWGQGTARQVPAEPVWAKCRRAALPRTLFGWGGADIVPGGSGSDNRFIEFSHVILSFTHFSLAGV